MSEPTDPLEAAKPPEAGPTAFERAAQKTGGDSLAVEFFSFLAHNKKWWLLPIFLVMLLLALLIMLSNSPLAPFIYTMF